MKKLFKNLIWLTIMVCTISTISLASNSTNASGKGTVNGGSGTEDDPYQLVMGEGVIDIYYAQNGDTDEQAEARLPIYFEFTEGNVNAGNYLIDHSADKHRIRLTLLGTDETSLRVTPQTGLNYLQAGAITYIPEDEQTHQEEKNSTAVENALRDGTNTQDSTIQTPYYKIMAIESFEASKTKIIEKKHNESGVVTKSSEEEDGNANLERTFSLGNGYLTVVNNTLLGNASNYATSYIFAKSGLQYTEAYKLSEAQEEKINRIKLNYTGVGNLNFSDSDITKLTNNGKIDSNRSNTTTTYLSYDCSNSNVRTVYMYSGTNSAILDPSSSDANPIEEVITKVLTAFGDLLVKLILGGNGGDAYVTIDSLIFNVYPYTIANFFGDTGYTNAKAQNIITFWFNAFKIWAIIIYIILLVFVGIKAMLSAGTPEQRKVKDMFEGWLQGLLMLFFLPFLFKYLITINDAIVDVIRTNSKYSIYSYYTFESYYDTFGGQEDGEDSTTSVLERLQDAKANLTLKIEEIDQSINNYTEAKEEAEADLERETEEKKKAEETVASNKKMIEDTLAENNYKLMNTTNGFEVSVDAVEADLNAIVKNFYDENREELIENEEYGYSEIRGLIADYSKDYNYVDENGNTQGNVSLVINEMGYALTDFYTQEILIGIIENEIEDLEKQEQEYEEQMENLDKAIIMAENGDTDMIGIMRTKAGETSRIFYLIIWMILVFEVIILLVLYYKRIFMLMALIAIFPLVTVAYVYEKVKMGKAQIMKNWMQEYILNVFIQTIHALLYVTLIETGYTIYLADNDSWLIYLIAVTSLMSMERIVKALLGLRGSTVTELGKYGMSALGVVGATGAVVSTFSHTVGDLKNISTETKNQEAAAAKKNEVKDERENTRRLERDNRINQNSRLTAEQRKLLLDKKHEEDERKDKKKEIRRKRATKARTYRAVAKGVGRVATNVTGAAAAVAGGLAAGGDFGDFQTAASVVNTITGTGGKAKLSDDAKKIEEAKEKERVKNELNKVNAEAPIPRNADYNGSGYDDYYNGGGNGNGGSRGRGNNSNGANNPSRKAKLASSFRRALGAKTDREVMSDHLDSAKIYVNKKYNIQNEEDKNN